MKFTFAAALLSAATVAQIFPEPLDADLVAFPQMWRQRFAYCKMQANPAYSTTNPYGFFRLQQSWGGPLTVAGWMRNMPPPTGFAGYHGFSFNWSRFSGDDCRSTEGHFNPTWEEHGEQDSSPSHVGALWPIIDWGVSGNAYYYTTASRPSLFGGSNNISNRSMVIYEDRDDFGNAGTQQSAYDGTMGREIACCNVRPFRIRRYPYAEVDVRKTDVYEEEDTGALTYKQWKRQQKNDDEDKDINSDGRLLSELLEGIDEVDNDDLRRLQDEDGVDVFTMDEYRQLFGEDFNLDTAVDFDTIGQN